MTNKSANCGMEMAFRTRLGSSTKVLSMEEEDKKSKNKERVKSEVRRKLAGRRATPLHIK